MTPWLIVAGDFVRTGGMDAANHALASYLARSGRVAHLVAHRVEPELAATPNVVVHRVPRPLGSHLLGFPLLSLAGSFLSARPPSPSGSHLFGFPLVSRGGSFFSARPPAQEWPVRDLVTLANGGNFAGEATWLHYVHAAYRPVIAGRPVRRLVERAARWKALRDERAVVSRARVVLANSVRTALHAVELLGADPERVHTVYYGSDEHFRPPSPEERERARGALRLYDERPALAFVGALGDRRKGFDTLFEAFAFLCAREPGWDARLLVAGAGGELEAWKRRAMADRLGGSVRFLGFRADVREVLWGCDGIVSPTRYEAYGLAVHEALFCGLPAVMSRAAGVAERVPPALDALLLDDPGDAGELAERLLAWRAGLAAHRSAALAAAEALRAWTWDDMARRIVDIVEGAG